MDGTLIVPNGFLGRLEPPASKWSTCCNDEMERVLLMDAIEMEYIFLALEKAILSVCIYIGFG